jgi:hypothetical protein
MSRAYRPQPLIVPAPTLAEAADVLADLARLWAAFTGRALG